MALSFLNKLIMKMIAFHSNTDPANNFCKAEPDGLFMQSQKTTVRGLPEMYCLMDLTASKWVPPIEDSNPSTTYNHGNWGEGDNENTEM